MPNMAGISLQIAKFLGRSKDKKKVGWSVLIWNAIVCLNMYTIPCVCVCVCVCVGVCVCVCVCVCYVPGRSQIVFGRVE